MTKLMACATTALLALSGVRAESQVVRGRVTEARSSAPVAGVLVSLAPEAGDSLLASVLSGADGAYAIRAPRAGTYRVIAKRIGVRRYASAPLTIGEGETQAHDIAVDAIAMALPEVFISGLCVTPAHTRPRVSALWDEVRTAFFSAEVSLRDSLVLAQVTRHAAELDPSRLVALYDWRTESHVSARAPFTSRSAEVLSRDGYWRAVDGNAVEFQAPDASALASDAFVRDHCFSTTGAPRGQVALRFGPAAHRRAARDIEGVIYLDAVSFEVDRIEFTYTNLPDDLASRHAGGEVHFRRVASGAWIVERWFIRMPQRVVDVAAWVRDQVREEGGMMVVEAEGRPGYHATVRGTLRGPDGPVSGALIRAVGLQRQTLTDGTGQFVLDSLPAATEVSIVARTDAFDSLAVLAAATRVTTRVPDTVQTNLQLRTRSAVRQELCPPRNVPYYRQQPGRGAVRALVLSGVDGRTVAGALVRISWPAALENRQARPDQRVVVEGLSDARGAVTFCDVAPGVPVQVTLIEAPGVETRIPDVIVRPNDFEARLITQRTSR